MTVINTAFNNWSFFTDGFGNSYKKGFVILRNTSGGDRTAADKAAGIYPEHGYSGNKSESLFGTYDIQVTEFGVLTHPWHEAGINSPGIVATLPRTWDANDEIELLGKLADKIRDSDWNLPIFVGELGKTVDSVTSRVKQLTKAAQAAKRFDVAKTLAILRAKPQNPPMKKLDTKLISGNNAKWFELWLELRYAWRPLVKDIYDLSRGIQNLDKPRTTSVRVRHGIKYVITSTVPSVFTASGSGFYSKSIKATFVERAFSLPEYLGLADPEIVAWELVPLSFVADWFIPIGNYLQTRATLSRANGTYVRTTYDWHRGQLTGFVNPVVNAGVTKTEYRNAFGYLKTMSIDRTLTDHLDVPLPTFRDPSFNRATRLLDAIALLTAVFKR